MATPGRTCRTARRPATGRRSRPNADNMANNAKQIPALFPEGSMTEKSKAKPEIWQKKAEFDAAAKKMETESIKLRDTARTRQRAGDQRHAEGLRPHDLRQLPRSVPGAAAAPGLEHSEGDFIPLPTDGRASTAPARETSPRNRSAGEARAASRPLRCSVRSIGRSACYDRFVPESHRSPVDPTEAFPEPRSASDGREDARGRSARARAAHHPRREPDRRPCPPS